MYESHATYEGRAMYGGVSIKTIGTRSSSIIFP